MHISTLLKVDVALQTALSLAFDLMTFTAKPTRGQPHYKLRGGMLLLKASSCRCYGQLLTKRVMQNQRLDPLSVLIYNLKNIFVFPLRLDYRVDPS